MVMFNTKKNYIKFLIKGLVAITPASGFVKPYFSLIFGLLAGIVCFFSDCIKKLTKYKFDDTCDVFAGIIFISFSSGFSTCGNFLKYFSYLVHGIGGIVGNTL
jgi:hypothetical protein